MPKKMLTLDQWLNGTTDERTQWDDVLVRLYLRKRNNSNLTLA